MKYYVHNIPGRLRVRIPSLRINPRNIEAVKTILNVSGTEKIEVNPHTGSVVVNYDPDSTSARHLLGLLQNSGYYHEDHTVTLDAQLRQASNLAAGKVGKAMFGWAVGKVLEANGLSLIAALI